MAQARGPEAAQALNEAALQKDRITILPNVAAKEGVNNLPVSDKELHALGRFIAERVDIGDR